MCVKPTVHYLVSHTFRNLILSLCFYTAQRELDIDMLLGSGPSAGSLKAAVPAPAARLPFGVPQHRAGALSQRVQTQAWQPAAPPQPAS